MLASLISDVEVSFVIRLDTKIEFKLMFFFAVDLFDLIDFSCDLWNFVRVDLFLASIS